MGSCDLPEIYALAVGLAGLHAHAYISGKSLVPMLQLLFITKNHTVCKWVVCILYTVHPS